MNDAARVLIATEVVDDAALVRKLLRDEFETVETSTVTDRSVADFERVRPAVLVIAFNTLEKAQRYYLGLYRLSSQVHLLPHRTVILCEKEELRQVYELCKRQYFDDYVLFWPMGHDAVRLPMAVHHALRQLDDAHGDGPSASQFAAQARRIAGLEALLEQSLARGNEHIALANDRMDQAKSNIGAALDGFSRQLSQGARPDLVEVRDRAGLELEIQRLKTESIETHIQSVAEAVQPLRHWAGNFKAAMEPQLASARELQSLAGRVRPVILVVDDDAYQRDLLGRLLDDIQAEVVYASSGTQALAALRRRLPNLILMDVQLPDMDGIDATRRLKSVDLFADVPVVMITSHSERGIVAKSMDSGASDFLVKPVDKNTLLTKVRRLLGHLD